MTKVEIVRTEFYLGPTPTTQHASVGVAVALASELEGTAPLNAMPWRDVLARMGVDLGAALDIARPEDAPWILGELARISLAIQRAAGHGVNSAHVRRLPRLQGWEVRQVYEDMGVALWASEFSAGLISGTLAQVGADPDALVEAFGSDFKEYLAYAGIRALDPNSRLFMRAADARGVPWLNLDQRPFAPPVSDRFPPHGLIQFGHGRRRRVILGALPEGLPQQVLDRMHSPEAVRAMLTLAGVPIPRGDTSGISINRASRAVHAAERIGFPVVMRPALRPPLEAPSLVNLAYGPLNSPEQVGTVYESLAPHSRAQIVEEYVAGESQRWMIVGARVCAVARRFPATVRGDGSSTVSELIQRAASERTGPSGRAWRVLSGDQNDVDLRLYLQGLRRDDVLTRGEEAVLSADFSPFHGGTYRDCTDEADPRLEVLALNAARACGLDAYCAVDLVVTDAAAGQGVVVDVVSGPDIVGHHLPESGTSRDVAGTLLDHWFAGSEQARVPVLAVVDSDDGGRAAKAAEILAELLTRVDRRASLVTPEGVRIDGQWLVRHRSLSAATGAVVALADPRTELLVIAASASALAHRGYPFDRCDAAACLDSGPGSVHAERVGQEAEGQPAWDWVVEHCAGAAVISVDAPACRLTEARLPAEKVILISREAGASGIDEHLAAGGMALSLESQTAGNWIRLRRGGAERRLGPAGRLNGSGESAWLAGGEALYAVALALAIGVDESRIAGVVEDAAKAG